MFHEKSPPHIPHFYRTCYMSIPYHPPWSDHPINVWSFSLC